MMFYAFLALRLQSEDVQLSATDKAVIEAAVKAREKGSKQRIVFVYDTPNKDEIAKLLKPADKKAPCVGLLLQRNETSVSLKGYQPSWAALSASQAEAKDWLKPKSRLYKETVLCSVSLPSYCGRGTYAAIYVNEWVKLGKHVDGGPVILKLDGFKVKGKWKLIGTIGKVLKA
jgi:hypothetical protein